MPADTMLERSVPRSALRYRPRGKTATGVPQAPVQRASRPRTPAVGLAKTTAEWPDVEDEDETAVRTIAVPGKQPVRQPAHERHTRRHPLFLLGVGMLLMLALWVAGLQVFSWGESALNTLRYGYPRTFQIDAVVGHQDSASSPSHFLVLNLHGQIEVIEFPGGDATHARIFLGPQLLGPKSDQEPVTLRFVDLNGDHKPDMVIEVQGSQIVFLNDQGSFRPLKPEEQNQIMQCLRQLGQ